MPIKKDHDEPEGWLSLDGGWEPPNTIRVAMDDLPEAKRITLEKELEEETAVTRRKLACF
jgi:hypothetical protein